MTGQPNLPFKMKNFIAEIGVNHENKIENAYLMIEQCASYGVGAVKFQSYTASKLAAKESPAYWDTSQETTNSQFKLFSKYDQFGKEEFEKIARHCQRHNIEFMSTPFDVDYVQILNPLVQRYKVASVDLTNHVLLKEIASTGMPVIMSTGASTMDEIKASVELLQQAGAGEISLLHCIVNYPTKYSEAGLSQIAILKQAFPNIEIGYSDHTIPEESQVVLLAALAMGASVIEKHYTFDKTLPGNDHYHGFDINDLADFSRNLELFHGSMGEVALNKQQSAIKHARRGMYATRTLYKGELLKAEDVLPLRPQMAFIGPNHLKNYIGRKISKNIEMGQGVSPSDFED